MDGLRHRPGPDLSLTASSPSAGAARARFVRDQLPAGGLFAGHQWRISPDPFPIDAALAKELESLGRVLLQFYRAVNLLYRHSVEGKAPAWVANLLDQGKPARLIEHQRLPALKNALPRVIRPDLLLTETGLVVTELDSVPGGMGLTAWLNQTYDRAMTDEPGTDSKHSILGGAQGMSEGFRGIFGQASRVHIVVSEEASVYRPEMEWLCQQAGRRHWSVRDTRFSDFEKGDAVYRFFELFDLENVGNATQLLDLSGRQEILMTPPAKPIFEEKLVFALLWNRNLRDFWRQQLGESFLDRLFRLVPYTWVVDPAPLPPHAAIPELNLTDWQQLKTLSQRERDLILKVSGYSEEAWGARGVYLGSDLSQTDWSAAVDKSLQAFGRSPYILQRFHKPRLVEASWYDFDQNALVPMPGRVRLCPYYFVHGEGDAARAHLGGALATICPADKKIIHGMRDAILVPGAVSVHPGRPQPAQTV